MCSDRHQVTTIAWLTDHEVVEVDLPQEEAEKIERGEPTSGYVADDQMRRFSISLYRGKVSARLDQIDKRLDDIDILGLDGWDDLDL